MSEIALEDFLSDSEEDGLEERYEKTRASETAAEWSQVGSRLPVRQGGALRDASSAYAAREHEEHVAAGGEDRPFARLLAEKKVKTSEKEFAGEDGEGGEDESGEEGEGEDGGGKEGVLVGKKRRRVREGQRERNEKMVEKIEDFSDFLGPEYRSWCALPSSQRKDRRERLKLRIAKLSQILLADPTKCGKWGKLKKGERGSEKDGSDEDGSEEESEEEGGGGEGGGGEEGGGVSSSSSSSASSASRSRNSLPDPLSPAPWWFGRFGDGLEVRRSQVAAVLDRPGFRVWDWDAWGQLHVLSVDGDPVVARLAMLSQVMVAADVLPEFVLRDGFDMSESDRKAGVKVTKQVRAQRREEGAQLRAFRRLLVLLSARLQGYPGAALIALHHGDASVLSSGSKCASLAASLDAPQAARRALALAAARGLGELLRARPEATGAEDVVRVLVGRADRKEQEVAGICVEALRDVISANRGTPAAVVAEQIALRVRNRGARTSAALVQVLCHAPARKVLVAADKKKRVQAALEKEAASKGRKTMGKRAKKQKSASSGRDEDEEGLEIEVEEAMRAADPEDTEARVTAQVRVVKAIAEVAFRLVRAFTSPQPQLHPSSAFSSSSHASSLSPALSAALDALGRVAHLIDLDTVAEVADTLLEVADKALEEAQREEEQGELDAAAGVEEPRRKRRKRGRAETRSGEFAATHDRGLQLMLPVGTCVQVCKAGLEIARGPGRELEVDVQPFGKLLFAALRALMDRSEEQHVLSALEAVQMAFVSRFEADEKLVAAVFRRILAVALQHDAPEAGACLSIARRMLDKYSFLSSLLQEPLPAIGVVLQPRWDGVVAGTALGTHTPLWELHTLASHAHPTVAAMAQALLSFPKTDPRAMVLLRSTATHTRTELYRNPGVVEFPQLPRATPVEKQLQHAMKTAQSSSSSSKARNPPGLAGWVKEGEEGGGEEEEFGFWSLRDPRWNEVEPKPEDAEASAEEATLAALPFPAAIPNPNKAPIIPEPEDDSSDE